ncbi:hypothetical protein Ciccas_010247 [Cichlidogyrus casuarinus]|uniref:Uncharacterized protein n=1 Tax=Cichlidogyrus casuarinus TaxID=1844966 RepID=A0ABD2PUP5_9PLAT
MDTNKEDVSENSQIATTSSICINNSNISSLNSDNKSATLATPGLFNYFLILIDVASPPNFISMDQLSDAANLLYNMNLVHEITVDSDFKLEMFTPPEDSLAKKVKETMHNVFWDILKSSLEADPVDYTQAFRLLEEAKESLLGLLINTPNNRHLRAHIEAKLDLDQARTQLAESGMLDLEDYGKIVIDLMAKMCAPARDDDVAELRTLTDPIEVFKLVPKVF